MSPGGTDDRASAKSVKKKRRLGYKMAGKSAGKGRRTGKKILCVSLIKTDSWKIPQSQPHCSLSLNDIKYLTMIVLRLFSDG